MTIDTKDKNESRKLLLALSVLVIALIVGVVLLVPAMSEIMQELNTGVSLKNSAIISFFVTLVLMVILTLASGDGIIGEIQFLLVGFLLFFIIIWLMIAWVF